MPGKFLSIISITLIILLSNGLAQSSTGNWVKKPATYVYSRQYEKNLIDSVYQQNQKKHAFKNKTISSIEYLLANDTSLLVRMDCAKYLKNLKSIASIPVLINELKADDRQLKLEIALTLAALGEKTECLKALKEISSTGERNLVLDAHLGYLDIDNNEAVLILNKDLSNTDPYISVDAAIVLAELEYFQEAFPVLKSNLLNDDKYIRMASLRGLAYIGNDESISLIRSRINDTEQLVKDRSKLILNNCNLPFSLTESSPQIITNYNPVAASDYADKWWNSRNTVNYLDFSGIGGDCANFVSQCLLAGGMDLSAGPGNPSEYYGCIINCNNLHINFTTRQGCNVPSRYSGHLNSGYPSWFTQGDVALFGADAADPGDPWQHSTINVVTGTPALDAHSNDRYHQLVSFYYPSTGTGFKTGDFYHFTSTSTSVITGINFLPKNYSLSQNYPNPFNPSTTINYILPFDGIVSLKVYDMLGREIIILVNDYKKAGSHSVGFNAVNLPAGTYFYQLRSGSFIQTKKLILLK